MHLIQKTDIKYVLNHFWMLLPTKTSGSNEYKRKHTFFVDNHIWTVSKTFIEGSNLKMKFNMV